jgi:hypothetical protein
MADLELVKRVEEKLNIRRMLDESTEAAETIHV